MTSVILGTKIHAQTLGTGPRPALAIHCAMGNSRMWRSVLSPLEDQLTTTVFDLPGHGQSGDWDRDIHAGDYQKHATQIAASFIRRPVDIIGHSFGTAAALRIAVAAPDAVRSLTLIEPILFKAIEGTADYARLQADQTQLETLIASGQDDNAVKGFIDIWGAAGMWEALTPDQRARRCAQLPIIASASRSNLEDPGDILRPDGLESIDAPVLLIHGDKSPASVAQVCQSLAPRFQDVGTACVPNAGHMVPITHAQVVSDLIAMNIDRS
ncbi:hypothetical protein BFP70_03105 [Thioclava sp. SK-1]|uniref:alpha/beta fold hydrolase n=1 Tax=Thioclava sp. SK-1 TaxID=1889770 RepID=UPI00082582D5|nr:alpha/beta hydrolase [Thioclava sp. SK-1]OCX67162.1 hypothetical protein BFP70_03105 [Thioclava sp. SK-1]